MGLVVAWAVVLIPNLRMPIPSDHLNYLQAAANFPDGLSDPDGPPGAILTHQELRFGLTLPTRLAIEVFGYSQAAYYAVPMLAVVILLISVYALGCMLFGRAVGAGGAVLVLSTTPIFREQSYLMPDLLSAALFTAAIALCVALRLRRLPRRWFLLVAIGVLLGWSYMVREFVVFGWPLAVVLLWRRGRAGLLDFAWVAGPMVGLFLIETGLCWTFFGDPLARLKAASGHGDAPSVGGMGRSYRDKPLQVYVLRLPEALRGYHEGRWLLGLLGLTIVGGFVQAGARLRRWRSSSAEAEGAPVGRPVVPGPWRVGRQAVALLLLWCAMIWVPLTLLGGVLDPSAPKLRLQLIRYWFAVFPAFVLGGLGVIFLVGYLVTRKWKQQWLPAALVIAVAGVPSVLSVEHLWAVDSTRAGGGTNLERFRAWMSDYEKRTPTRDPIWTDSRTDGLLRVYQSGPFGGRAWSSPIRTWRVDGPQPTSGDLVLTFAYSPTVPGKGGARCDACRKEMTSLMERTPVIWADPIYRSPDGELRLLRMP